MSFWLSDNRSQYPIWYPRSVHFQYLIPIVKGMISSELKGEFFMKNSPSNLWWVFWQPTGWHPGFQLCVWVGAWGEKFPHTTGCKRKHQQWSDQKIFELQILKYFDKGSLCPVMSPKNHFISFLIFDKLISRISSCSIWC